MVEQFDRDQIIVEGNEVKYHGLNYFIIEMNTRFKPERLEKYDILLIDLKEEHLISYIVKEIRSHFNSHIALKPIFLMDTQEYKDLIVRELTDGNLPSINHLDLIESRAINIIERISRLNQLENSFFEAQIILKMLTFQFTRSKKDIIPHHYFHSGIGYYYPSISINFTFDNEIKVLQILNQAEANGLIRSEYHEHVYLCVNCNGGYLTFREMCPNCNSTNSIHQDLVHHFPCAYVGPMEDFSNGVDDTMICPKCDKLLQHIGVDYDKPSVLYTCQKCHHKYQDYHTKGKCMTCGEENEVESLTSLSIKKYFITKKGEHAAITGFINLASANRM